MNGVVVVERIVTLTVPHGINHNGDTVGSGAVGNGAGIVSVRIGGVGGAGPQDDEREEQQWRQPTKLAPPILRRSHWPARSCSISRVSALCVGYWVFISLVLDFSVY